VLLNYGTDPYHNTGQAMGLSFSVPKGTPVPSSLQNIYKELNADLGCTRPSHGCLLKVRLPPAPLLPATLLRCTSPAISFGAPARLLLSTKTSSGSRTAAVVCRIGLVSALLSEQQQYSTLAIWLRWRCGIVTGKVALRQCPCSTKSCHVATLQWAEQGVLLLNASLTVRAHTANSHAKKVSASSQPLLLCSRSNLCSGLEAAHLSAAHVPCELSRLLLAPQSCAPKPVAQHLWPTT